MKIMMVWGLLALYMEGLKDTLSRGAAQTCLGKPDTRLPQAA
jgi:hypothetical protein